MDKVVAIITRESKVLIGKVVKNEIENFGGLKYVFPGGSVEKGESLEEALIREVQEETALAISVANKIGERIHPITEKKIHYFHCEASVYQTSTRNPFNDDISELIWVEISDIRTYMESIYPEVERFLKNYISLSQE